MMITAASSNEFSSDYFIGANKKVSPLQRLFLKLTTPFLAIKLFYDAAFAKRDKNYLTKNKKKMTGKINVSTSPFFHFPKVKDLSKKLGVTINDIVMCALSTAIKEYLKNKGDPLGEENAQGNLSVMIPANIRWGFPKSREEVTTDNCFASMPVVIPLCDRMKESYTKI
mgnify:CR=1 FL=1|jgi:NRPS condensation-like uncharacterized protein